MAKNETISTHEYSYTVIFEPAEEGGFVATVPALPSIITDGDTLGKAREMVTDAIRCHLESMQKDGIPIPAEPESGIEIIREAVKVQLKTA